MYAVAGKTVQGFCSHLVPSQKPSGCPMTSLRSSMHPLTTLWLLPSYSWKISRCHCKCTDVSYKRDPTKRYRLIQHITLCTCFQYLVASTSSLQCHPFCPTLQLLGQEPAVRWAQRHSAGKFCHGDGRNLTWLPEAGCGGDNGGDVSGSSLWMYLDDVCRWFLLQFGIGP